MNTAQSVPRHGLLSCPITHEPLTQDNGPLVSMPSGAYFDKAPLDQVDGPVGVAVVGVAAKP